MTTTQDGRGDANDGLNATSDAPTKEQGSYLSGTAKRPLSGRIELLAVAIAVSLGLYHTLTAGFGVPGAFINRPIHLAFAASLVFIWYEAHTGEPSDRVPWYDWILVAITLPSVLYLSYAIKYGSLAERAGQPLTLDLVFGMLAILVVLEMTRRTTGIILPTIGIAFVVYALFGPMMPGMFAHRGYGYERIITHLYLTTEGIFGIPLGVSATFVVLFIIFGAFLEVSGVGDWFIDVAYGYTGRLSGGPAKTSVLASGFMASLNGSAVANTATTGAFTIPLMKRTGFDDHYAAAVESSASSGGQIMPPVMGAGAFIMAVWTGISYVQIITAAAIPAMLYFLSVGAAVHFRAKKRGHEGLPADQLPNSSKLLREGIHFTIPIITIVYLLAAGYTAMYAGFVAIVVTVIVATPISGVKSFLLAVKNGNWSTATSLVAAYGNAAVDAFNRGIQMALIVAAACATAGVVVGVVTLTGLGLKFSSIVASVSGGVLIIGLLLTMITAIILGMGLPTTAAYVVVAALGAPALTELGVELLAAHLFIFYFAIISAITPPIMLAVFTASSIADSDPWKTGLAAIGIALVGFLIPFMFVYGPELILIGSSIDIVLAVTTAVLGVLAVSASTQAYLVTDTSLVERVALFAAALGLLLPGLVTDVPALAVFLGAFVRQYVAVNGSLPFASAVSR
ncbi:TRAP transporter permease [Natribaculum luteum]|uniref:TRAP transporter permease n=1 Tax=Natribaculum luteum TaxID=1586232 RepID=A0ABD5NY21_9EURY|nr:TRAP transporter permease [Natribaculum luteum]